MIEYRFRVPSAAVFTLYSYSRALEYRFRVPTAGSLILHAMFFFGISSLLAFLLQQGSLIKVA
jgi:hypothetical protein